MKKPRPGKEERTRPGVKPTHQCYRERRRLGRGRGSCGSALLNLAQLEVLIELLDPLHAGILDLAKTDLLKGPARNTSLIRDGFYVGPLKGFDYVIVH
jgi:hypothetical protein